MIPAGPQNNWHYNPALRAYANELRKSMTKAEACLWKYALRAGKMKGYQFRRQRPILTFIADFACLPLLLVVEVDGLSHDFADVGQKDEAKTQALEAVGFSVLRFSDEEVLRNLPYVVSVLEGWIAERERQLEGQ